MTETHMTTTEPERKPLVFIKDGEVYASSRDVAERFEKRHSDVLRAVEQMDCSEEFRERNFAFSTYRPDGQRRDYPYAALTRDGFTFLVMGFTGKEAAVWKERYIEAFNMMEAELRQRPNTDAFDPSDPSQLIPLLTSYAERTKLAEAKVEEYQPKVDAFDQLMNSDGLYGLQNAARAIGARPNLFVRWLKTNYLFYQGNALVARVRYTQMGVFEVISTIVDDKARPRTYVTPKGLEYLRKRVPSDILSGEAAA